MLNVSLFHKLVNFKITNVAKMTCTPQSYFNYRLHVCSLQLRTVVRIHLFEQCKSCRNVTFLPRKNYGHLTLQLELLVIGNALFLTFLHLWFTLLVK